MKISKAYQEDLPVYAVFKYLCYKTDDASGWSNLVNY